MAIVVQCSGCGHNFRAPDEAAGKRAKCPNCATPIQVGNILQEPTLEKARPTAKGAQSCGTRPPRPPVPRKATDDPTKFLVEPQPPPLPQESDGDQSDVLSDGTAINAEQLRLEYWRLKESRTVNAIVSIVFGLPGFLSPMLALLTNHPQFVFAVGECSFMVGLGFAAMYKGRNPAWGVVGLLWLFALPIMLVLWDYHGHRMSEIRGALRALGESP